MAWSANNILAVRVRPDCLGNVFVMSRSTQYNAAMFCVCPLHTTCLATRFVWQSTIHSFCWSICVALQQRRHSRVLEASILRCILIRGFAIEAWSCLIDRSHVEAFPRRKHGRAHDKVRAICSLSCVCDRGRARSRNNGVRDGREMALLASESHVSSQIGFVWRWLGSRPVWSYARAVTRSGFVIILCTYLLTYLISPVNLSELLKCIIVHAFNAILICSNARDNAICNRPADEEPVVLWCTSGTVFNRNWTDVQGRSSSQDVCCLLLP